MRHAFFLAALMLALIGCGSGSDGGAAAQTLPSKTPIGTACAGEPTGIVEISSPVVDLSQIVEARFSLSSSGGFLSMARSLSPATGCGCCMVTQPTFSFRLNEQNMSLGSHPVGPGASDVHLWLEGADSVDATSGTISLEGFDPNTKSLCGTVSATFDAEGTITAKFSAYDICP